MCRLLLHEGIHAWVFACMSIFLKCICHLTCESLCASISFSSTYCARHTERLLASKQFNMSNKHTAQWAAGEQSERRERREGHRWKTMRAEERYNGGKERLDDGGEQLWAERIRLTENREITDIGRRSGTSHTGGNKEQIQADLKDKEFYVMIYIFKWLLFSYSHSQGCVTP